MEEEIEVKVEVVEEKKVVKEEAEVVLKKPWYIESEYRLKPTTENEIKSCNDIIEMNEWNVNAWEGVIVAIMREPREPIQAVRHIYERYNLNKCKYKLIFSKYLYYIYIMEVIICYMQYNW